MCAVTFEFPRKSGRWRKQRGTFEFDSSKVGCISEMKINRVLFCISLDLHYLCTVLIIYRYMKKLIIVLIVLLIAVLMVETRPDKEKHKEAMMKAIDEYVDEEAKDRLGDNVLAKIGHGVVVKTAETVLNSKLKENNYYLFNTTSVHFKGQDNILSLGLFGYVYTFDKEMIHEKLEEALKAKEDAKTERETAKQSAKELKRLEKEKKKREKELAKEEKRRAKEAAKEAKRKQKEAEKEAKRKAKEAKKNQ